FLSFFWTDSSKDHGKTSPAPPPEWLRRSPLTQSSQSRTIPGSAPLNSKARFRIDSPEGSHHVRTQCPRHKPGRAAEFRLPADAANDHRGFAARKSHHLSGRS